MVGLVEFVEHVGLVGLVGCNILAPEPHFRQLIAKLWVTLLTHFLVVTWLLGDQCLVSAKKLVDIFFCKR